MTGNVLKLNIKMKWFRTSKFSKGGEACYE